MKKMIMALVAMVVLAAVPGFAQNEDLAKAIQKEISGDVARDAALISKTEAAFIRSAGLMALLSLNEGIEFLAKGDGRKALVSFNTFEKWNAMSFPGSFMSEQYASKKKLAYALASLQYLNDSAEHYTKGELSQCETCRSLAQHYMRDATSPDKEVSLK